MKKLTALLILSLLVIISGCVTTEKIITVRYVLPEVPQRVEMNLLPENPTAKDYAFVIQYYSNLVEEWELWGASVKEILKSE